MDFYSLVYLCTILTPFFIQCIIYFIFKVYFYYLFIYLPKQIKNGAELHVDKYRLCTHILLFNILPIGRLLSDKLVKPRAKVPLVHQMITWASSLII